jgi:hypothetical protein
VAGSAGGGGGLGSRRDGSRNGGRGDRETGESESKHLLAVMCIQIGSKANTDMRY